MKVVVDPLQEIIVKAEYPKGRLFFDRKEVLLLDLIGQSRLDEIEKLSCHRFPSQLQT